MNQQEIESTGMCLLKKGKKGLARIIFSRIGLLLFLMALQALVLISIFQWFEQYLGHIYGGIVFFMLIMVLYLLNSRTDPTAKITWLVLILVVPFFGAALLLYTKMDIGHRAVRAKLQEIFNETKEIIPQSVETMESLSKRNKESAMLAGYIGRTGCFPVYHHTEAVYFPSGEDKFTEVLIQLRKAKKFIFLEYFIIDEGLMWGKILEILAEKAKENVEVRVMYDGTCEFSLLPHDYPKRLRQLGIKCKIFSPVTPFVSTHYNYRDHRKILVIDGQIAFTGGINLADEYINHIKRFGHWKDVAIMLKGEAAKSFTLMFLQMWNIDEKLPDYKKYLGYATLAPEGMERKYFPMQEEKEEKETEGYVLPYADSPLDNDKVGERVYMDILNQSKEYVHIMSPYLILDGEMEAALKFAAERGVDVKLILPGIPDKEVPYALAKTHYYSLLESGVEIYEYTPGFVHAKLFISDNCKAVVGTINLDYRSLYHHFECAAYLYGMSCIVDIEKDFDNTLKQCQKITKESIKNEKWQRKMIGVVMKFAAPLM